MGLLCDCLVFHLGVAFGESSDDGSAYKARSETHRHIHMKNNASLQRFMTSNVHWHGFWNILEQKMKNKKEFEA